MHLIDVNVLIARADPEHEHHAAAVRWMARHAAEGWITCPLTENAFVRILGHPSYPGGPGSPERAASLLRRLLRIPGHDFWPDDVSLLDAVVFPSLAGVHSSDLTDLYLLALAVQHEAQFVTFDTRVDPALIDGGTDALHRIRLPR